MSRIRDSLFLPVIIGVAAILCTIAILVGWSILFTKYYSLWTKNLRVPDLGMGYWLTLVLGCLLLAGIVTVLVLQLIGVIQKTLYVRQQDIFIDGVTHEFKSPLASIRLCLETMEMRELTPELQQRFVGMMKKDVERLIAFVEHILEAGRLEHNQRDLRYEITSIVDAADRCIGLIRDRYNLPADAISVEMDIPSLSTLHTDAVALETILLNLLDNAVKHSPPPVDVTLWAGTDDKHLHVEVRDRGQGIPKHLLKVIFQRFYRIRRDGRYLARGTGLGLYVVASLAKRLGGSVKAISEGEGKGSTFRVEIPLAEVVADIPTQPELLEESG